MVARSDGRDVLEAEGTISEWSRDRGIAEVSILGRIHRVRVTRAGKLQLARIRILPGDKVRIEISPYDTTRGRVVYRNG